MKKNNNNETQQAGAAPQDDYPETPTFPNRLTIQPEVVDNTELADASLAAAVGTANNLVQNLDRLARTVRESARQHLLQSISLGYLLSNLQRECGRKRVNFTALFSDAKDDAKRNAALAAVGGDGLNITYRTAANYVKVYQATYTRMLACGGNEQEAARMLADHAAALTNGKQGAEEFWAQYVTAGSLRQAYLELAPAKPQPTLGETLDNAAQQPAPFAKWEARRANLCAKFGGWFATLDTYISDMSRYTTEADRLAQADQLVEAAQRLRAMKTQPDLPGTEPKED